MLLTCMRTSPPLRALIPLDVGRPLHAIQSAVRSADDDNPQEVKDSRL